MIDSKRIVTHGAGMFLWMQMHTSHNFAVLIIRMLQVMNFPFYLRKSKEKQKENG